MKYPRKTYLIVVYDRSGIIPEGIYVGSSYDVKQRIQNHLHDYSISTQQKLHELMRKRRFSVWILDDNADLNSEYDWIDFFKKKTNFSMFNVRTKICADWHRCEGKEEFKTWEKYITC